MSGRGFGVGDHLVRGGRGGGCLTTPPPPITGNYPLDQASTPLPDQAPTLPLTVNTRAVHILLECILVSPKKWKCNRVTSFLLRYDNYPVQIARLKSLLTAQNLWKCRWFNSEKKLYSRHSSTNGSDCCRSLQRSRFA